MSDYLTASPFTKSSAPPPINTSGAPPTSREQASGLGIHLVETPQGDMDEQKTEERVRDMDMFAQELEMAMAQGDVHEISLIEDNEPRAASPDPSQPHPESNQPLTDQSDSDERKEIIIAPAFSLLFGGPRPSITSASSPGLQSEICVITLPLDIIMSNRRADAVPVHTPAPRPMPPWFSVPHAYSSPLSTPTSPLLPSPQLPSDHYMEEVSVDSVFEDPDAATILPSNPPQAEQLEEPSAVLPPTIVTSPARPPSVTSFGDGRLQPSTAYTKLAKLVDSEDKETVILDNDSGNSNDADSLDSEVVRQGRDQPLLSPVQASALSSIATPSTRDTLLVLPSPPVELSTTGTVHKPTITTRAPVGDQRPREKKRKVIDESQPSRTTSTSFTVKKARKEFEPSHSSSSTPAASSTSAPPARNFILKTAPLPKRRSPPAARAPHTPARPPSHSSSSSTTNSTAGQSQNLKRKRDRDEEHGDTSRSGGPTGRPGTSSRDAPPASKKPKTYSSLSTHTPTAPQTNTAPIGHLRSAADLAHKRWEERMQQQQGGRMRVVSTDFLAMRTKVRGPRAMNVRDAPPASKKPKTYHAPTAPQTNTAPIGHLRSAADLAHKRWEERMQQQQGGRMRVVSTDFLAMRTKVRGPRATNVGR
ncbi:hypothetical protein L226DRAFT_560998 [Lentinus tigrinus ALCF2SS1-7]|uniref:Uncharacterized protein n=1 Tax=Lentinus tigrinus ALCF2SS1-6 TaxID=1328759 RepID=A0A5C2RYM6_9APHY|nr:hypothetical protein L227DRAFT_614786 [Lentinus tigrinus ALCF2SS1-6]RPD73967.1 hypothetical protein L226DRAFT_560998 [Lentinus tigrinus ALCF2SS1-7]